MIEAEVHSSLRDYLREHGDRDFPHHLTMARLIARALRLDRPALMQTGSSVSKYCLSYLMPILLGERGVIIVAPETTQRYLLETEIPKLQNWLGTNKPVRQGDAWQDSDRLLLTTPEQWLSDRLNQSGKFPPNIPTIIESANYLEEWTRNLLTIRIGERDWQDLATKTPEFADLIDRIKALLTESILARPQNPYGNHILLRSELDSIIYLCRILADKQLLAGKFQEFWQRFSQEYTISWISRSPGDYKQRDCEARAGGNAEFSSACSTPARRHRISDWFAINLAPGEVRNYLQSIWQQQPIVILGGFLDIDSTATNYKQLLGLDTEMLSLKFTPNRQNDRIKLYLPDRLPLPNTPDFQSALIEQSLLLVSLGSKHQGLIVLISDDVPLQGKVGAALAAEFGSRVKVESTNASDRNILICSWFFWQQHQENLPNPRLAIIATLPIPSLENPLVANRVTYYKNRRQDWFRLYLLPTALKTLEQIIVPLRESQSIIALLDNRVNSRSYGRAILSILEPCARINYLDPTWFGYPNS